VLILASGPKPSVLRRAPVRPTSDRADGAAVVVVRASDDGVVLGDRRDGEAVRILGRAGGRRRADVRRRLVRRGRSMAPTRERADGASVVVVGAADGGLILRQRADSGPVSRSVR